MKLEDELGITVGRLMVIVGVISVIVFVAVGSATFSINRARATACRSNLRVIRKALINYYSINIAYPRNLSALVSEGSLQSGEVVCPDTRRGYEYDEENGDVKCPTLGHESF
ncbi:MAG: hypothetical protein M1548_01575 [Actinobacteria bacterium]|nr:hypothetical protein [Actinomycetota bacterium]